MTTKEVCQRVGTTPKALRVYEEQDLIKPIRDRNNYRLYKEEDLIRLREIIILKELGFSLKETKDLLHSKVEESDNRLVSSLYMQYKAVDQKLNELENIKETLGKGLSNILVQETETNQEDTYDNLVHMLEHNRQNRKAWIDHWDFNNKARLYDDIARYPKSDELGLFTDYDANLEIVRNRVKELNPKHVLDIGCGTGNLGGPLSEELLVTGLDQSVEMLIQCKKKYRNMDVCLGNFLDQPVKPYTYDVVVSSLAFHVLDPNQKKIALNNMMNYLKNKGSIIILDYMFESKEAKERCKKRLLQLNRKDLWEVVDKRYYTDLETLTKYVRSLGWTIKSKHVVNFTWYVEISI